MPITLEVTHPETASAKADYMAYIENQNKTGPAVSISTASQITGVEVHTLRYWEREFAGYLNPIRTRGGQRRYKTEDIATVFVLKQLLRDEMFSIAGAKRHLQRLLDREVA